MLRLKNERTDIIHNSYFVILVWYCNRNLFSRVEMEKYEVKLSKKQKQAWDMLHNKTTNEILYGGGAGLMITNYMLRNVKV